MGVGNVSAEKDKWFRKTVPVVLSARVLFWKEEKRQQRTTGINAGPALLVINDLQAGTWEHLQSPGCA